MEELSDYKSKPIFPVRIIGEGYGWYKGLAGQEFDVIEGAEEGEVWLAEDLTGVSPNGVIGVRYIQKGHYERL